MITLNGRETLNSPIIYLGLFVKINKGDTKQIIFSFILEFVDWKLLLKWCIFLPLSSTWKALKPTLVGVWGHNINLQQNVNEQIQLGMKTFIYTHSYFLCTLFQIICISFLSIPSHSLVILCPSLIKIYANDPSSAATDIPLMSGWIRQPEAWYKPSKNTVWKVFILNFQKGIMQELLFQSALLK